VLASKSSISGVILAVFLNLSKGYVYLTAYLDFFNHDDILTTGVLTKQSKNVLFSLLIMSLK
jgi:hypothetical protein